jgi:hypothetical protein
MLIICSELEEENKVKCQKIGWIAFDPETNAHLRCVVGVEKRYIFYYSYQTAFVIDAESAKDAVDQANQLIMKLS